jgi:hypothetical protein
VTGEALNSAIAGFDQPQVAIGLPHLDHGFPLDAGTPVGDHGAAHVRLDAHLRSEPAFDIAGVRDRFPHHFDGRVDFCASFVGASRLRFWLGHGYSIRTAASAVASGFVITGKTGQEKSKAAATLGFIVLILRGEPGNGVDQLFGELLAVCALAKRTSVSSVSVAIFFPGLIGTVAQHGDIANCARRRRHR